VAYIKVIEGRYELMLCGGFGTIQIANPSIPDFGVELRTPTSSLEGGFGSRHSMERYCR